MLRPEGDKILFPAHFLAYYSIFVSETDILQDSISCGLEYRWFWVFSFSREGFFVKSLMYKIEVLGLSIVKTYLRALDLLRCQHPFLAFPMGPPPSIILTRMEILHSYLA